ncbi:hypothetical protein PR048_026835 [Dryococelus australis]|uniref:Uncharacterized protein n=1 Tax=Dryococelus australis TaxID=614101 RepID=A0ABQ9GMG8_9NEOP|nr:hypothetical protein PR048_026835 [Dryococelus australis]
MGFNFTGLIISYTAELPHISREAMEVWLRVGGETDQPHFKLCQKIYPKSEGSNSVLYYNGCIACYSILSVLFVIYDQKTSWERFECVKQHKLCIKCLQLLHIVRNCPSSTSCHHCSSRHYSLLHFANIDIDNSHQQHDLTESVEMPGSIVGKKK